MKETKKSNYLTISLNNSISYLFNMYNSISLSSLKFISANFFVAIEIRSGSAIFNWQKGDWPLPEVHHPWEQSVTSGVSRLPASESLWYFSVYQCFYPPALFNTLIRRCSFFFTALFVIVREGGYCSPDLFIISSSFLFITEWHFNALSFDILRFSYLAPPHGIILRNIHHIIHELQIHNAIVYIYFKIENVIWLNIISSIMLILKRNY